MDWHKFEGSLPYIHNTTLSSNTHKEIPQFTDPNHGTRSLLMQADYNSPYNFIHRSHKCIPLGQGCSTQPFSVSPHLSWSLASFEIFPFLSLRPPSPVKTWARRARKPLRCSLMARSRL